jgi:hypothetical protein
MTCSSLLASEKIIVDFITKQLSFINLLDDEVVSPLFPIFNPLMVYCKFEREAWEVHNPELDLEIKLNDNILSRTRISLNFTVPTKPSKTVINSGVIPITAPGTLTISVVNVSNNNAVLKSISSSYTIFVQDAVSP